mmetsp:Transcript_77311/g.222461  ORF Transcript_77311/g.222461 Transcript_77311/m.222461 type:complete len:118 (-) Transcript_77311:236-589(-)
MGPLGGDSLNETVCVLSSDVRPDKVARSRKQRPQPLRFAVGSRVQAQWKGSGDMFPARVVKGNAAVGMYHLKYDDGDEDIAVPASGVVAMGPGTLVRTVDGRQAVRWFRKLRINSVY